MLKWTVAGGEGLVDRSVMGGTWVTEDPLAAFTLGPSKEYNEVYRVHR